MKRREFIVSTTVVGSLGVAGCLGDDDDVSIDNVEVTVERPGELRTGVDNIFTTEITVNEAGGLIGSFEIYEPWIEVVMQGTDAEITHVLPGDFAEDVEIESGRRTVSGYGVDDPWTEGETKSAALAVHPEQPGELELTVYVRGRREQDGDYESLSASDTVTVVEKPEDGIRRGDMVREAENRAAIARGYSAILQQQLDDSVSEQLRRASLTTLTSSTQMLADGLVGQALGVSNLGSYLWETTNLFASPFEYVLDDAVPDAPAEADIDVDVYGPPFFSQLLNHADAVTDVSGFLEQAERQRIITLLEVVAEYAETEADMWHTGSEDDRPITEILTLVDGQLQMLHIGMGEALPRDVNSDLEAKANELGYSVAPDIDRHSAVTLLGELTPPDPAQRSTVHGMQDTLAGQHDLGEDLLTYWLDHGFEDQPEDDDVPTEIEDWFDLDAVREDLDGDYVLVNDLDSATPGYDEIASPTANDGQGFKPIGMASFQQHDGDPTALTEFELFTGTFNGNGNTIQDLVIDRPGQDYVGLISAPGDPEAEPAQPVVENLRLVDADITGGEFVGGLAGAAGPITQCHVSGSVTGDESVGGLAGVSSGPIQESSVAGEIIADEFVGGVVGINSGPVVASVGSAVVTGNDNVGGIVGLNGGIVERSFATGEVNSIAPSTGGLVGANARVPDEDDGLLRDSYWDGESTGITESVGVQSGNLAGDITILETSEMQGASAESTMPALDFDETWDIVTNPDDYPVHQWRSKVGGVPE